MVLFSGTPCQIAGLYAVLGNDDMTNLITCDIVCHGVPSPAFLSRQIKMDSLGKQGRVKSIKFRHKNPNAESISSYMMMMMMERGLPVVRRVSQDLYYKLFMDGMSFRESCYNCKYANLRRLGDFTFGDCDSNEYYKDFHPNESNSIILVNTEKAQRLWRECSSAFDYVELNVDREALFNHQLEHPFERPKERNGIYSYLINNDWAETVSRYACPQSKLDRYKLLILLYAPAKLKEFINRIRK